MRRNIIVFAVIIVLLFFFSTPKKLNYGVIENSNDNTNSTEESQQSEDTSKNKLNKKFYGATHVYEDSYTRLPIGCHAFVYQGKTQIVLCILTPLYIREVINAQIEQVGQADVHAISRLVDNSGVTQKSYLVDNYSRTVIVITIPDEYMDDSLVKTDDSLNYVGMLKKAELAYNINDSIYYVDILEGGSGEWIRQLRMYDRYVIMFAQIPYTITNRCDDFEIK